MFEFISSVNRIEGGKLDKDIAEDATATLGAAELRNALGATNADVVKLCIRMNAIISLKFIFDHLYEEILACIEF